MDVQIDGRLVTALAQPRLLTPGYLLTPLRWAAGPLVAMIQAEPGLLIDVFELDRTRMHLIALALSHLDDEPPPHLASILLRASTREVLRCVLGRSPAGIKRVLTRLPFAALSRHGYRRLIKILDDPRSAKLLHHFNEAEITDSMIRVLHAVPAALRPTVVGLVRFIDRLDHLPDGLRWLASRGAAASFEALVADLAACIQPGQFIARLKALISELPLPETLPPDQIGKARRIDTTAEIYTLGKRFKNCLATRAKQIDAGECAIYLWDEPVAPALCQVTRRGRLGWALSEVLGPRNAELEETPLAEITTAFARAGVPHQSTVSALEAILQADRATGPHAQRLRRQDLVHRLWELEEAGWVEDMIDADT